LWQSSNGKPKTNRGTVKFIDHHINTATDGLSSNLSMLPDKNNRDVVAVMEGFWDKNNFPKNIVRQNR
jgi:hypothetical protein